MARKIRIAWSSIIAGLCLTAAAAGQTTGSDGDGSIREDLDTMREEIEKLRGENARMRDEIEDLHLKSGDNWLSEQRAEEIKALVQEVLDDADNRTSLQTGMTAGWNEHFFLADPDGRFKLQLEGQIQFRYVFNYRDIPDRYRHGFELSRVKTVFRGHVFSPDITYLIRGSYLRGNGDFGLDDAWIRFQLNNNWAIRIGQYKVPYLREFLVNSAYQLTVERSLVSILQGAGRSQGIEFQYTDDQNKVLFMINDGAQDNLGGFGNIIGTPGPNTAALDEDVAYSVALRYERLIAGEWKQFIDFTSPIGEEFGMMWGLALLSLETESGTVSQVRNENRWFGATTDISVEWGGANLFASFVYNYADSGAFGQFDMFSTVIQGGVYFTPKIEAFARWEYGWWVWDSTFPDMSVITLGANYYLDGHDLKWTTDIGFAIDNIGINWDSDFAGWRTDNPGQPPQVVFRTQFQLLF